MTDYRLVATAFGGPEVISVAPLMAEPVAPGQARVRHTAIGVNFIDIYHRTGLYPQALPAPLGVEAAGVIEALGDGVTGLRLGQRVAYAGAPGSYASWRDIAADRLLPLPDGISEETAAAAMLKALTVHMLIHSCSRIKAGQTALVHSAAGGVGRLLVQWLASIDVRVIAHSGSPAKAAIATGLGAALSLHCPFDELAAHVREATHGLGVDVTYDGVGAASWVASLNLLRRRGMMISFGNASGVVPPITLRDLTSRGSLTLIRPSLFDYIIDRTELETGAEAVFAMLGGGKLDIEIGLRLPLREAAEAHRALENRRTSGSIILLP